MDPGVEIFGFEGDERRKSLVKVVILTFASKKTSYPFVIRNSVPELRTQKLALPLPASTRKRTDQQAVSTGSVAATALKESAVGTRTRPP